MYIHKSNNLPANRAIPPPPTNLIPIHDKHASTTLSSLSLQPPQQVHLLRRQHPPICPPLPRRLRHDGRQILRDVRLVAAADAQPARAVLARKKPPRLSYLVASLQQPDDRPCEDPQRQDHANVVDEAGVAQPVDPVRGVDDEGAVC